jgi:hypothetical protein
VNEGISFKDITLNNVPRKILTKGANTNIDENSFKI